MDPNGSKLVQRVQLGPHGSNWEGSKGSKWVQIGQQKKVQIGQHGFKWVQMGPHGSIGSNGSLDTVVHFLPGFWQFLGNFGQGAHDDV